MPKLPFHCSTEFPYHITARSINKDWFEMPMDDVWMIMSYYLYFIHHAFHIEIRAFVLMSNHFHLIAKSPNGNLSLAMNYFMRETSRSITKVAGRINQTYGSRFFRSLIDDDRHFLTVYKYVYRNPVESGMTSSVEDYKYSTLNGLLGRSHLLVPVQEDAILFSDIVGTLKWLNTEPLMGSTDAVRKALKKQIFKISTDSNHKRIHPLNYLMY
jgi:putative transposase